MCGSLLFDNSAFLFSLSLCCCVLSVQFKEIHATRVCNSHRVDTATIFGKKKPRKKTRQRNIVVHEWSTLYHEVSRTHPNFSEVRNGTLQVNLHHKKNQYLQSSTNYPARLHIHCSFHLFKKMTFYSNCVCCGFSLIQKQERPVGNHFRQNGTLTRRAKLTMWTACTSMRMDVDIALSAPAQYCNSSDSSSSAAWEHTKLKLHSAWML